MKKFLSLVLIAVSAALVMTPGDADAKRLGGGRPAGMQRQAPAKQPAASPDATPNQGAAPKPANQQAAAPTPTAPQPAAPAGKRSWMGPIAGLAAGLGIASLMSHFGMGGMLANFVTMALVAVLAVVVIGWVMRRLRGTPAAQGPQLAGAGAPYAPQPPAGQPEPLRREALDGVGAVPATVAAAAIPAGVSAQALPPGFDAAEFTRVAKMIFIRLQAANDASNIEDLRKFTTPELFASLRLDLQERGGVAQQTDVMQLDAELVDAAKEDKQWIVSVRFHGLIREEADHGAHPFDELWHLVKPEDGSREWAIAGITPLSA